MSTQSTANVNPTAEAQKETKPGRDASGRFTAGNRGGPGNPFARQTAALRKALVQSITEDDVQRVAKKMLDLSLEGNVAAATLLFSYVIGKPQPALEPDRMDAHEWEGYQETACMKAEAAALSNVGTPEFHLDVVRTTRPIVTAMMQNQIAELVNAPVETPEERKKREDAEAAECERILNSPAPAHFYEDEEEEEEAPSANGGNGRPAPSTNGGKRRPQPSTNGGPGSPAPSTNGRSHGA